MKGATPQRELLSRTDEEGKSNDRPRRHTTLRNPLDEGEQATGARVEGLGANERLEFGEGPTRKGTATDYGCCESKRSGDRHPGGVPAGQGEAAVKWPWSREARHPARSEIDPIAGRLTCGPECFERFEHLGRGAFAMAAGFISICLSHFNCLSHISICLSQKTQKTCLSQTDLSVSENGLRKRSQKTKLALRQSDRT